MAIYPRDWVSVFCRGTIFLSIGCVVVLLTVQQASGELPSKCYRYPDKRVAQRCVPEFGNAAFGKRVISSNTCGTPPAKFCVQTSVLDPRKECEICNNDTSTKFAHPPRYITDIKEDEDQTWWQSQSLDQKTLEIPVTLQIDLGKSFDVTHIRIRFRSPRPESMAIYKKTSYDRDAKWIPYQYFSHTCRKTYKIDPSEEVPRSNQQKALCSDRFSSIMPLTGADVSFITLKHRPSAFNLDNSPSLQDWITAVAIKIDLDRMNTFGDEVFGDPTVLSSYYFAIIDLTVTGQCKCNGHAASCIERASEDGTSIRLECDCEHNTDGVDCQKCLPLYNDRKWARASPSNPNVCRKCECNGLATSCVFDEKRYRETGRGGVCVKCTRNTAGPNCERCKENFFRATPKDPCLSCKCNPVGSVSLQCRSDGQCVCKRGVTGVKCDKCQPNFFGFSQNGCRQCNCHVPGTDPTNTQCNEKGECNCKRRVIGPKCTKCRSGYYGLEETNPHGCRQCFCHGHSTECKASPNYAARNITTEFDTGLGGWIVENKQGKNVTDQYAVYSPSGFINMTAVGKETLFAKASLVFYGNRRSSYGQRFGFKFRVGTTEGVAVDFADITLEGEGGLQVTTQLTSQRNPLPTTDFQNYAYRLHEHPSFGWEPRLTGYDFQRLLSNLKSLKIRVNYADQGTGMLDDVFFESTVYDPATVRPVNWVEKCSCPPEFRGNHCEQCNEGFTRELGVDNRYGICIPCQCNSHTNSPCDPVTGKCLCIHNTAGLNCDVCIDGYYGNPTQGTPQDCKPCPCKFGNRCIQVQGDVVCTDCPPGHMGNLCDRCQDGYYGDPMGLKGVPIGCQKCNCSGNIDPNAIGSCDPQTGDCLKCIYNTRNGPFKQCELCAVGFYGNATQYPKPQCKACECYAQGTVSPPGHDPTVPYPCDEQGRCTCLTNVVGDKCDSCIPEYWNVGSGRGCEQCKCDPTGSYNNTCDVRTGQCACKPGVTGLQCDRCAIDHYAFSAAGCLPCNCNPQGSLNVTCNEQGICECRPGVLGIKCDSCRENYHNLTAGCIACPPCYDEIQKLVQGLRIKLHELIYIIDRFNTSDRKVIDVDFEDRLRDITARVNKLLKQAEKANGTDKDIQKELAIIDKQVNDTRQRLLHVWRNSSEAYSVANQGAGNISLAESSLNVSRHLLDLINKLLMEQGAKALNESITNANNTDENNRRMREILEETTKLANKHEAHADEITTKSEQAANASELVVKTVDEAVSVQNQTTVDIEDLYRRLEETGQLQVMAKMNVTEAHQRSSGALSEASKLYEEGTSPLPDLNITVLEESANMSHAEAESSKMKSEKMIEDLRGLVASFDDKEDDVRKKMAEWPGLLAQLKQLLADIDNANTTAWEAFLNGENTLKKAQEMKETLEKFNSIIEKSRKDAEKAAANIPEIERLINSANEKSDNATNSLGDAQALAKDAKDKANEAQGIAEDAREKAAKIRKEAEDLSLPVDTVSEPAKKAAAKVVVLKDKAITDKEAIGSAKDKAGNATAEARKARAKIDEVLKKLLALLKAIDDLDSVNVTQLEKLENKLQDELNGLRAIEADVNTVEETQTVIRESIKKYTIDIDRIKKEMKTMTEVLTAMPRNCKKKTSQIEGQG